MPFLKYCLWAFAAVFLAATLAYGVLRNRGKISRQSRGLIYAGAAISVIMVLFIPSATYILLYIPNMPLIWSVILSVAFGIILSRRIYLFSLKRIQKWSEKEEEISTALKGEEVGQETYAGVLEKAEPDLVSEKLETAFVIEGVSPEPLSNKAESDLVPEKLEADSVPEPVLSDVSVTERGLAMVKEEVIEAFDDVAVSELPDVTPLKRDSDLSPDTHEISTEALPDRLEAFTVQQEVWDNPEDTEERELTLAPEIVEETGKAVVKTTEMLLHEALQFKTAGQLEKAAQAYEQLLEEPPEKRLVQSVILDLCALYKKLNKKERALSVLESKAGELLDGALKTEIIRYL